MGGAVALWTAITAPARVRSLIAGAMSGNDPEGARAMGRQFRGVEPMTSRAELYRDYALGNGVTDLTPLAAALESGLECPECVDLAVYGGEALLVAGEQDRRAAMTEEMSGCLPGGRFVLIPGADHMGAFKDPRFFAAASEFLAEVSPP
jgi:pimeloyl-ACP methyl ester carboxylesterase